MLAEVAALMVVGVVLTTVLTILSEVVARRGLHYYVTAV